MIATTISSQPRWRSRLPGVVVLFGLLAGCAAKTNEPADVVSQPPSTVEIGGWSASDDAWIDWPASGAEVDIVRGPAGCCHIWVSLRWVADLSAKVDVSVEMRFADTGELVWPGKTVKKVIVKGEPPSFHVHGIPGFIYCPCRVRDQRLRVRATVTDTAGAPLSGEAKVTPRLNFQCADGGSDSLFCIKCPEHDNAMKCSDSGP